jgi:hypothetical protein
MRIHPGWRAVVLGALCVAVGPALRQAGPLAGAGSSPAATVEPGLPLAIDLRFDSVSEARDGGTALLLVTLAADADIPDLSIDVVLPESLRVQAGTPTRGLTATLGAGERRRYEIPLVAGHQGVFPIRAEVVFRLTDGRSFREGQGTTLRLGVPSPQGRLNAGAYEVRAVPLEELPR